MRIIFSRRTWIKAGIVCLPCLLSSGCKSTGPGLGWLSWTKPKSLASSLATTTPTKPSVNALPPPSTTLGNTGSSIGTGTNLAGQPGGPGYIPPAGSVPNTGYNTGPYGMAGQTNSPPAGSVPSYAGAYSGASTAAANPGAAYNAFPQHNHAAAPAANSAYRTADSRNAAGGAPAAAYGGSAPAGSHNWNNEQWGRSEPRGGSQPAGYTEGTSGYGQAGGSNAWNQPQSAAPAAATGYGGFGGGLGASSTPANTGSTGMSSTTAPAAGGYRPGSTGRSAGALPSSSASDAVPASGSSYSTPAGSYPASNYPTSSAYPSTDAGAPRTANSTGYAGGYSYPSTTQTR